MKLGSIHDSALPMPACHSFHSEFYLPLFEGFQRRYMIWTALIHGNLVLLAVF